MALLALYWSTRPTPSRAVIAVQITEFREDEFSFFVANLGKLPTVIRDFDLDISLAQADGMHVVSAAFSKEPFQLMPGESQLVEASLADFERRYTNWQSSDISPDEFTTNFLYGAAALVSNLHCEVKVHFPTQRYFPSNIEIATDAVNGACSAAMAWYAEAIGPLADAGDTSE